GRAGVRRRGQGATRSCRQSRHVMRAKSVYPPWRRRLKTLRRVLASLTFACLLLSHAHGGQQSAVTPFASAIASLSERGGYFDTDNLISNESSYLQVMPDLKRRAV